MFQVNGDQDVQFARKEVQFALILSPRFAEQLIKDLFECHAMKINVRIEGNIENFVVRRLNSFELQLGQRLFVFLGNLCKKAVESFSSKCGKIIRETRANNTSANLRYDKALLVCRPRCRVTSKFMTAECQIFYFLLRKSQAAPSDKNFFGELFLSAKFTSNKMILRKANKCYRILTIMQ